MKYAMRKLAVFPKMKFVQNNQQLHFNSKNAKI